MTAPVPIALEVNGERVEAQVLPRLNLADFLREHLHLTGTHLGCEQGVCGTCMVKRVKGTVALRQNYVLSDQDLAAGFTLACQGVPCDTVCEIEIEG